MGIAGNNLVFPEPLSDWQMKHTFPFKFMQYSILILAVFAENMHKHPSIFVTSPLQGSEHNQTIEISWRVDDFFRDQGSVTEVILFVNGIKAHATMNTEGSLSMEKLHDGAYRIEAMLATYDEIDGVTSVISSHVVEFYVGRRIWTISEESIRRFLILTFKGYCDLIVKFCRDQFTKYEPTVGGNAVKDEDREVVIFVYHCNRPDFLDLQVQMIQADIMLPTATAYMCHFHSIFCGRQKHCVISFNTGF